jgi:hypothetical protein
LKPLRLLTDRPEILSPTPKPLASLKVKILNLPALINPLAAGFAGFKTKKAPVEHLSKTEPKPSKPKLVEVRVKERLANSFGGTEIFEFN